MIDERVWKAGYAAAVGSIVLVVFLLAAAFLTDLSGSKTQDESGSAQSNSGEAHSQSADGEGAREDESADGTGADEQSDPAAADGDPGESAAEIMALSGSDLWRRFDGAVLTGDSRVVGFSLYTAIPDDHVKARNGATIAELSGFSEEIAALAPDRVFIAFGINDIKSAVGGNTAAGYAEYAGEKIGELQEALGDAQIYVNSILPASRTLAESDPDYRKVGAYNRELREMCRKHGWHYIDNDEIASKYADLYVSDGIHLEAGFYEHWGRNMLIAQAGVHKDEGGTEVDR